MSVRNISAVTFAVSDMSRSVRFYRSLGLEMLYGGEEASCTSFDSCGERIVIPIDPSGGQGQEYVEDCPVCCNANVIRIRLKEGGEPWVHARSE